MGSEEELLCAIRLGEVAEVRRLVNAGANVCARRVGKIEGLPIPVMMMRGGGEISPEVFPEVYFPLHLAVSSGNIEIVKILLDAATDAGAEINFKDEGEDSPLHKAVGTRNIQMVEMLLERGADPNAKNLYRETPVFFAVMDNDVHMVEVLAQRGARLDCQNRDGDTPLHRALDSVKMVRVLMGLGANVNIQNDEGNTPLHLAIQNRVDMFIIIDLVTARNADINIQNKEGNTALHLIASTAEYGGIKNTVSFIRAREVGESCRKESSIGNIVRVFMTSGADFSIKNKRGKVPEHDSITEVLKERSNLTQVQKPSRELSNVNSENCRTFLARLGIE